MFGTRVFMSGDKDIWLYGSTSDVYHYNGTTWYDFSLYGVTALWSSSASNAWAFDSDGIKHYAGTNWDYVW
jgi:hypothetical protein